MNPEIYRTLTIVLENWQSMQSSAFEDAEEDAERFETSFYEFTSTVKNWLESTDLKILTFNQLLQQKEIKEIFDKLPGPLYINFEMELEEMLEESTNEKM